MGWAGLALPWGLVGLMAWTERPYLLDLASHFLVHAAAAMAAAGLVLVCGMRRVWGINLLMAAGAVAAGWRLSASAPGEARGEEGEMLRIVLFNMHLEASRHDNEAMQWVLERKPDVIVLIEPPWWALLDWPVLKREFPVVIEPEAGLMWSTVMVSRRAGRVVGLAGGEERAQHLFMARRCLEIEMDGGRRVLVAAMHPLSPRTTRTWGSSVEEAKFAGGLIRSFEERTGLPVVVVGDFNSTPMGRVHRTFARASGLRGWSPAVGGGTWPAWLPSWVSLPIDRTWTGGGAWVRRMEVGPRFRSDHRPVFCEVVVPARPEHSPSDGGRGEPFDGLVR
jgi:endonuclease/exonuclease/phosphatase (EEP) superfamily protein YafD